MGGCATKPKVSNPVAGKVPVPAPEPAKEEVVLETKEKEVVVAQEVVEIKKEAAEGGGGGGGDIGDDRVKEIVDDDKADDKADDDDDDEQGSKRRSLSLLFKNEEGKDSTEKEKQPEVSDGAEKALEEQTSADTNVVVDAPLNKADHPEIAIEDAAAAAAETQTKEKTDETITEKVNIPKELTSDEGTKETADEEKTKETSEVKCTDEAKESTTVHEEKAKDVQVEGGAEENSKV